MEKIKKSASILIVLCMLLSMLPVSVFAVPTDTSSGTCGTNLSWELSDNGVLSIEGIGDMPSYASDSAVPWNEYRAAIKVIEIGTGITSIGDRAFISCTNLQDVIIPNSVTSIGEYAFYRCTKLDGVIIGSGVTTLRSYAFGYCFNLTNIIIPDSVTTIDNYAFSSCDKLEYNTYDNAKYLGNEKNPYHLLVKTVSEDVATCTIHPQTKLIAEYAFSNCINLKTIKIPDGVIGIGDYAFRNCTSLINLSIPQSVVSIGEYSFRWCASLTEITIPDSVDHIGVGALSGCSSLTKITIPFIGDSRQTTSNTDKYPVGYIFGTYSFDNSSHVEQGIYDYYVPLSLKSITVTGGDIYFGAFRNCTGITEIIIPNNITSIGRYAFYNCANLNSITIPDSVTVIDDYAFSKCPKLTSVVIPNNVNSIGANAFAECSGITYLSLSCSLTHIDEGAFSNCSSLNSITIPNSLTHVGGGAFAGCGNLNYNIYNDAEYLGNPSNPYMLLNGVTSKSITSYEIHPDTKVIMASAFYNCKNLRKITIPDGVTCIGYSAFCNCTNLASVTIPDSVSCIDEDAFFGCLGLENVFITDVATWCMISLADEEANPLRYAENLYVNNSLLSNLVIPDGVTEVGSFAFAYYDNLTSITIPGSVVTIGKNAFSHCRNISKIEVNKNNPNYTSDARSVLYTKDVSELILAPNELSGEYIIPATVTRIENYAFNYCTNLTHITVPERVEAIGKGAFYYCINLVEIDYDATDANDFDSYNEVFAYVGQTGSGVTVNIGANVKKVPNRLFYPYSGAIGWTPKIIEIKFWGNAPAFGTNLFNGITATAYYPVNDSTWTTSVMQNYGGTITWVPHDTSTTIRGLSINNLHKNFFTFLGDSHIYNMYAPNSELFLELNQIAVVDNDVISPADIVWTSSDETILKIISSGTEGDMYVNLRVEGLAEGTATLTAANPDGETLSFDVTVIKPNTLAFTNIHDTKQYYSSGAFYSAASSISDSVEIFVQFENALIDGYPCKVESDLAKNVSNVEPITLTATVSGSELSFNRNSYQNTYTTTYDPIKFDNCVYDILMLFPYDVDSYEAGTSYTVNLTLESDSFAEPIEETYSFTVYDAEKQRVDEHISFTNNSTYKVSKQNIYGTNMLELKGDDEYQWSKWTSFDFDNYYEVVLADILVGMLDVYQVNTSIVPAVLKEWHGTYTSLLGDVTTMVEDSYSDVLDVSEMKIDKILKVSKYTNAGDGIYADDDVYQVVLDMFGNVGNVDKIQAAFAAVDYTKKAFSIVKLTGDVVKDFVTWGNSIAVLNAFAKTDENFKQVFRDVANCIPDSEKKMKEAIEDYLNYSVDFAGQFSEIYDSFCDLGKDVALDTFEGIVGKKLLDWLVVKSVGWIGNISFGGVKISTTAVYSTITSEAAKVIGGSALTGVSLGLCLSDLICDSSDKAAEMSKIIAMSEYAPYIIQTLEYYEDNLYSASDNNAVDLFEKAFGLHQASQSYIMDHTVKALEVKGESILFQILGNDDYDRLVAEILVQKNAIDSMDCCGTLTTDTVINNKKVIAIKCPVDVYVYSEDGSEVVCIINDGLQFAGEGITVYIRDRAKYIALPTNQTYSVKIVATDTGTMDYIVQEFDEELQLHRTVQEQNIALVDGRLFTGQIAPQLDIEETHYELTYVNNTVGDVDADGEISDWDAILLNRYLAGWGVEINLALADTDGDGEVSDWDAIVLERYLAGWDVEITAN